MQKVADCKLTSISRSLQLLSEEEGKSVFPISAEEFQAGLKIPLECVQGIWKKSADPYHNLLLLLMRLALVLNATW